MSSLAIEQQFYFFLLPVFEDDAVEQGPDFDGLAPVLGDLVPAYMFFGLLLLGIHIVEVF
jgi:hypothetical protein